MIQTPARELAPPARLSHSSDSPQLVGVGTVPDFRAPGSLETACLAVQAEEVYCKARGTHQKEARACPISPSGVKMEADAGYRAGRVRVRHAA